MLKCFFISEKGFNMNADKQSKPEKRKKNKLLFIILDNGRTRRAILVVVCLFHKILLNLPGCVTPWFFIRFILYFQSFRRIVLSNLESSEMSQQQLPMYQRQFHPRSTIRQQTKPLRFCGLHNHVNYRKP